MRVLVTRPEADAAALKAHLVAMGHDVFVEPLLEIRFDDCDEIPIIGAQCLVATSRNSLRALAQSAEMDSALELPLFVVGPATAAVARALGFRNVIEGPGTAAGLLDVVVDRTEVNSGPIVCLSGAQRAFDMSGELQRLGYQVLSPIVYCTRPAERFSARLVEAFSAHEIDAVLLFSPRTASTYARLLKAHNLLEQDAEVCHICLSRNVADQLPVRTGWTVHVAERPNIRQVLALLGAEGSHSVR